VVVFRLAIKRESGVRLAILRFRAGLWAATWTDSQLVGTVIKAVHIAELRTRLDEARLALGLSSAAYTDPGLTAGYTVKAVNVQELRTRTNEALTTATGGGVDLRWLVADQLGTPRIILDKTGALANVKRHDYLPFGEELFAGQGGRTTQQGYVADGIRQQFTSKERDNEIGLDFFGARFYSSVQGRFTGVDFAGPNLINPQSLNKYVYTLNNPLRYIDRNGLYEEDVHLHLTQALAEAAGFSRDQAWQIAISNQMTDETPGMAPGDSLSGFWDVEARRNYHFTTAERRQQLWNDFA